ncbi:MAG: protein kinase domain-containing protein [Sporichthyaceae bacterium]
MSNPPTRDGSQIRPEPAARLAQARRAVVGFGTAPDGLPRELVVDRRADLERLRDAVVVAFGMSSWGDLPAGVRDAVERDVAVGLMGVHDVTLTPGAAPVRAYVSRSSMAGLLGPSLLSLALEGSRRPAATAPRMAVSMAMAAPRSADLSARADALERAIADRLASRHLMIAFDESHWTATVAEEDRALRRPSGPFRRHICESLAALDTRARLEHSDGPAGVPIAEQHEYRALLISDGRPTKRSVEYDISRAAIVRALLGVARSLGAAHARGRVHADLSPGNILVPDGDPVAIDGLDLAAGEVATTATFRWAAPEQITGRPLDPRTDVFALAQMVASLIDAVPFGEERCYVVPTGNGNFERVKVLATEGVFIDVRSGDRSRTWQLAWQRLLSRALSLDPGKRPSDGRVFADELAEVAAEHPVFGMICRTDIALGDLVGSEDPDRWYRRLVDQGPSSATTIW